MTQIEVGASAPLFALTDQNGVLHHLVSLKGRVVVLYFYPKDDTPGCTKEACAFRDLSHQFTEKGAVILGISRDNVQSHKKFSDKYTLSFPLLADTDGSVCEAYGVLKEKNMYGKKSIGIERTTFLIDQEGLIAHIFPKVKVDGHVEDVLSKVEMLLKGIECVED